MMKLYTYPGACSTAPHIALRWAGLPFELELLTLDRLRSPQFQSVNPAGVVPALVDGDFVLTQNAAILGYISDNAPQAGLLGDGSARQRAEASRWLMLGVSDLHPSFDVFFAPRIHLQNPDHHEDLQAAARVRLRRGFERADARLQGRDWFAGFRSVADAYLYVMLRWAHMFALPLHDLRHLHAFGKRMEDDPGVRAALQAEGLLIV